MIKIFVDAARNIQTGQSAAGAVIITNNKQRQLKTSLPDTQNNQEAEFLALIWALKTLDSTTDIIQLYSDSQILIDAIHKNYAKHYQIYVDEISTLVSLHKLFLSQWLPEKENLGAHNLALQALK
ncbi:MULTISPECIES: ribonuclease HI family protein [Leuconostoc]|uniref:ribonuclease HI family protein n=1 Tax=Leuconostoc TaxID=1243 RepID=UPI000744D281|nr:MULTISPECIES: ribonuclease HI family protein [Leuconostoc]MBZ5951996.1 ribonuclease HI family protein [Leuconostoc gasicomitatum]MBZ5955609.1 ribonuclease HI family protein [Leuconostoc gasicomitatum]MBZ5960995.1 ribonuclease HI family protein [Leuconostoc gasicomitatum]MBZ5968163.1 ribonuclease HI family protein [Leuconostoc gasicomitatum]MBZ5993724.1 ribonuclease HI family protein [Leuconostoc gasicomitatum]